MIKSNSYKDLVVWQKAMELVIEIYKLTEDFPRVDAYGIVSQMQRASVSIPSNLAEGQKRGHKKEFLHFLYISYGSGAELETQLKICQRLHKIKELDYNRITLKLSEIMKMLNGLINALKKDL